MKGSAFLILGASVLAASAPCRRRPRLRRPAPGPPGFTCGSRSPEEVAGPREPADGPGRGRPEGRADRPGGARARPPGHGHEGHKELKISDLRRMWAELRATGDAKLVTVEGEDQTVDVSRKGDLVTVHVNDAGKAKGQGGKARAGRGPGGAAGAVVDAFLSARVSRSTWRPGSRPCADGGRHREGDRRRRDGPHLDRRGELAMLLLKIALAWPPFPSQPAPWSWRRASRCGRARGWSGRKPHRGARAAGPGPDGGRLRSRNALNHMPDGEARDLQRYLPVAQEMVDQLAAAPDGELVRVEDGDETVRIAKQGMCSRSGSTVRTTRTSRSTPRSPW